MILPEELVQVTMFHVFKHHDERVALHTHPIEGDDVFMLQVGEKLGLSVEIGPAALVGLFQCLTKDNKTRVRSVICKNVHLVDKTH